MRTRPFGVASRWAARCWSRESNGVQGTGWGLRGRGMGSADGERQRLRGPRSGGECGREHLGTAARRQCGIAMPPGPSLILVARQSAHNTPLPFLPILRPDSPPSASLSSALPSLVWPAGRRSFGIVLSLGRLVISTLNRNGRILAPTRVPTAPPPRLQCLVLRRAALPLRLWMVQSGMPLSLCPPLPPTSLKPCTLHRKRTRSCPRSMRSPGLSGRLVVPVLFSHSMVA